MKTSLTPGKLAFLSGTLLLTSTGFLCRILGFFYRIYMSRTVGAEGLGLYNIVHPVFSICFSVCAGSIQTAISQYVASRRERGKAIFFTGISIALGLSFALAWLICSQADILAARFLLEPRCAPYLPLIALSVPFAAVHACINGYYYGMQKARIPAFSQVAEQLIRMGAVFLIADIWLDAGRELTVELAVIGHLIGEMAAAGFTLLCLSLFPPSESRSRALAHSSCPAAEAAFLDPHAALLPLMSLALPLMGNRLVLNLLGSAESVWIPSRLMAFGFTNSQALSVYGVLTSMALPFVFFPSAITNSIAVLLLPAVAEAQARGNEARISSVVSLSLRYSCYMGILCIGIFTIFGNQLGLGVFHNRDAGVFITILCWLCPFMYIAATMGSILNGLGKTSITFVQNVCAMLVRLLFVLLAIPRFGILGYLWGLLASELTLALMALFAVRRQISFRWNPLSTLVKPAALLLLSAGIWMAAKSLLTPLGEIHPFLETSAGAMLLSGCYGALLLILHKKSR